MATACGTINNGREASACEGSQSKSNRNRPEACKRRCAHTREPGLFFGSLTTVALKRQKHQPALQETPTASKLSHKAVAKGERGGGELRWAMRRHRDMHRSAGSQPHTESKVGPEFKTSVG